MSSVFSDSEDLLEIETACWNLLTASVGDRTADWRLPVLGTISANGPRQRTVVLRGIDRDNRSLLFHSDIRARKISDITTTPNASLLFYDRQLQVQLSVSAKATVHQTDQVAEQLWKSESTASLRGYLAPFAPGTVADRAETNLPAAMRQQLPTEAEIQDGRQNFAALVLTMEKTDCVMLRRSGNLRAEFDYTSEEVKRNWLAP